MVSRTLVDFASSVSAFSLFLLHHLFLLVMISLMRYSLYSFSFMWFSPFLLWLVNSVSIIIIPPFRWIVNNYFTVSVDYFQ